MSEGSELRNYLNHIHTLGNTTRSYRLYGVFQWGHLVGNYGFLEGWEQCLQRQLGLVVVSRLVAVDRQNIKHV